MTALNLLRGMRFKGITAAEMITLISLHKGDLTNRELCELQEAESSVVSAHLKRLMKRG